MFERYSESARRTLFFARYEVAQSGGFTIEPEHLILGILRDSPQTILRFAAPGTTGDAIREALRLPSGREKVSTSVEIPFSADTRDALARTAIEADDLKNHWIRPEHLLLGVMVKTSGAAASALHDAGVGVDAIREHLRQAPEDGADRPNDMANALEGFILRQWKGVARPGHADAYLAHLEHETFPALTQLAGFVTAAVMRREVEDGTEFQVQTIWRSLDAIKAFAGDDVEAAVVPPAAQALLVRYDRRAVHYEFVNPKGSHR
jgi:heme-degrading monooxygenase HmoA